jgi:hypothetical protein
MYWIAIVCAVHILVHTLIHYIWCYTYHILNYIHSTYINTHIFMHIITHAFVDGKKTLWSTRSTMACFHHFPQEEFASEIRDAGDIRDGGWGAQLSIIPPKKNSWWICQQTRIPMDSLAALAGLANMLTTIIDVNLINLWHESSWITSLMNRTSVWWLLVIEQLHICRWLDGL